MNLSQIVEDEINKSPFISEALDAGIVNTSALARLISEKVNKRIGEPTSEAAIGMAIKRLPLSLGQKIDKSISSFMNQLGDVTVRSNLIDFSFRNSDTLLQCQSRLLQLLHEDKSYFYSSCKGVHDTTLICSEALSDEVKKIFDKEAMLMTKQGLSAVSIKLPPANIETYGIYYTILKRLAWKGINIVEMISTSHEISLIIDDKDVQEVFGIIISLKNMG